MTINPPKDDATRPRSIPPPVPKQEQLDEANRPLPVEPLTPKYEEFRESQLDPLGEVWEDDEPLSRNLIKLIHTSIILPYADIQIPLIAAYALIPSAMAHIVPILYIQGENGSGKSSLSILLGALYDAPIISAAASFASIRNLTNQLRWGEPNLCENEKNYCLIFDNVNRDTLTNESLYTFFLNGYNRKTDTISIAKTGGENMDFKVFGLKIMSSIHPLYVQSRFSELNRRMMIIKCKRFEKMNLTELQSSNLPENFSIVDRFDPEVHDLSILNSRFKDFWNDKKNLLEYVSVRRKLTKKSKSFKIPDIIDGTKWTIAIDLITTGIVMEIWESIPAAIEYLASYWQWHKHNIASGYGACHKILQDFISQETKLVEDLNRETGYEIVEREIKPEKLKKHMAWASSQGMLDLAPTPSIISDIMADLGWRLDKGTDNQICWLPSSK